MKIIDLLNRIANGEEVPEKIRVEGAWTYGIEFEQDDYKHYKYKNIDNTYDDLFDDLDNIDLDDFLNTEIIEEDKKIEKLPEDITLFDSKNGINPEAISIMWQVLSKIIDMINKGE